MRIAAILLALTIALAGCSGDSGDDEPTTTPSETQTTTSTTATTTTATATGTTSPTPETNETEENTPPTASLSASITNGEAPVEVNFTLDGADVDGDELTWTFDADEDGTYEMEGTDADLPANLLHEYASEGVYNATLTVSDGTNATAQTVTIDVDAAAAAPEGTTQQASLEWVTGAFGCTQQNSVLVQDLPFDGILYGEITIDAETIGKPYSMLMTGVTTDSLGGDISFYDADGFFVEGNLISGTGDILFEGMVPGGAAFAIVSSCGGQGASAEYIAGDF